MRVERRGELPRHRSSGVGEEKEDPAERRDQEQPVRWQVNRSEFSGQMEDMVQDRGSNQLCPMLW